MQETESFLESVPEDAVILCNFNHVQAVTAYYLKICFTAVSRKL